MKAVNLLPADARPSRRPAGIRRERSARGPVPVGALAVLGVLAVLVVALALDVLAANRVREHESRLAAVKAQERVAAEQIARLQTYGSFHQLAADRIDTVRKLAASRFDWERTLRDLSRAIPADVTLDDITATVAPGARAGAAASSNPLRAARAVPAVEIQGCTRDQQSVARLMARLRTVRGVTRVALSSSAKEDEQAGTSDSAGAGANGTAEGCGAGSRPEFEVVMFFEASPATSPDATGAGSTTPAPSATPAPGATPAPSGTPAAGATPGPSATPGAGGTPAPPSASAPPTTSGGSATVDQEPVK